MNLMLTDPKTLWFLAGLGFLAAEFAIPGFTLFFFGIGALITAGSLFVLPLNFMLQVCLFLTASMAGLLLFRSRVKTALTGPRFRLRNIPDALRSEVVGVEVDVIEDILPPHVGRVLLHGTSWQASAAIDMKKGERVRICGRDGLVLSVVSV